MSYGEWISAAERLPKECECVLAVINGEYKDFVTHCHIRWHDGVEMAIYADGKWYLAAYPMAEITVRLWMPIPPVPEVRDGLDAEAV